MHSRPATYWRALYVQVGSTPALPDSPRRQSTTSVSAQRPLSWIFGVALRVRAAAVQWVGQQRERPHMFGQDHREVAPINSRDPRDAQALRRRDYGWPDPRAGLPEYLRECKDRILMVARSLPALRCWLPARWCPARPQPTHDPHRPAHRRAVAGDLIGARHPTTDRLPRGSADR